MGKMNSKIEVKDTPETMLAGDGYGFLQLHQLLGL
jgi:hypothetical protein